jgi:hypothetical protein
MTQPWNPGGFAAPQAPAPQAAAPGPYVPPAAAPFAPAGFAAPFAPAGFAAPFAPAGYVAPAPQGAPPQHYGGPAFQAMPPNLDSQRDPDVPAGDHLLVATGNVGIVASGKLFQVEFLVERSTNPQAQGQKGFWKCWLQRNIKGGPQAAAQAASNDIGRLVVPLSGRTKDTTDANTAYQLVGEFANRFTIEGQPIAGRRIGAHVEHKSAPKKDGSKNPDGSPQMSSWVDCTFHVLPAGT